MLRNLNELADRGFDLVVVGGGIFGICVAWDAVLRGLSVALVERDDFAHATSAHSFRIVHGGVRYLQHADVKRVRQSSRERNVLLRIAPHLVHPLPILVPTYGHGSKGKELLGAGLVLYDVLTADRNRGISDPGRRIPRSRLLSRDEVRAAFPELEDPKLTGGALFHDSQMHNPPRLALSFLRSAVEQGACAANYLEAVGFLRRGERICGIEARDVLSGDHLTVRGRVVVNAAGPWAEGLLTRGLDTQLQPPCTFSRDACLVVDRPWPHSYGLAVTAQTSDPDAILSRKARHLFLLPWRRYTLVGVWHVVYRGDPDDFTVSEPELEHFLDEINSAYPPLALSLDDLSLWNAGLVLFGENAPGTTHLSYGKRSRIVDHSRTHGLEGLVSIIGVRFTTARSEAARAVELACKKLGRMATPSRSGETRIHGGAIEDFESLRMDVLKRRPHGLPSIVLESLVRNYGSEYRRVLAYADDNASLAQTIGTSQVLRAEVVHAVREEVAATLADVAFRRTDLASAGRPGGGALEECARLMADELGWDDQRIHEELAEVNRPTRLGAGRLQAGHSAAPRPASPKASRHA
jgi:glycerol-3-phosphate dehydrogenase